MSRIVDTIRRSGDEDPRRDPGARRTGSPDLGVVSYFHIHDHACVERVVAALRSIGVRRLRTAISWADWESEGGREWFDWVIPKLTGTFDVTACILYTPPSRGILPKTSSPPRNAGDYADFIEMLLTEFPGRFEYVELWNEPNNYIEWDWTIDPEWKIFAEMIGGAAHRIRSLGGKTVLGGMSPLDPNWLNLMFQRGAMDAIDVVGIHGFPGTWEAVWDGWDVHIDRVQEVLDRHSSPADIWITECGFSTWAHDEFRQVAELVEVSQAPVPRAYWYSAEDLDPDRETLDGFHCDERAYHFGLFRRGGIPKLAARVLQRGGLDAVRDLAEWGDRSRGPARSSKATLITGGAGFVGTNLADRLASEGKAVSIIDSLSRPGVEDNLRWLKHKHGDLVSLEVADLRDPFAIRRALQGCDEVVHLAAQVAVTTSVEDPQLDFDVNLRGTLNLLEEIRRLDAALPVLFTSTNKVYGNLEDIALVERGRRYEPADEAIAVSGVGEDRPLRFCSPYGCSKGGAEQYVLDYAVSFGLATAVLRMSCIYGPHQWGTEDQGWLAHFLVKTLAGEPITIYGDGKQVRDVLFVDDLIDALLLALRTPEVMTGRAFNIGGGPANTVSLLEVIDMIEALTGRSVVVEHGPWRVADQRYYVSDIRAFSDAVGWKPTVSIDDGLRRLHEWMTGRDAAALVAGAGA